ncbi:MAG UNVERIFIED_CONTAM: signal recognition particle receptor subunit alpha [Planctomycetaceae bacterium]
MFESISQSLGKAFSAFRGAGKITEANIREGMQQVRSALLEADVAYDVVRQFVQTSHRQGRGRTGPQVPPPRTADRWYCPSGTRQPDGPRRSFAPNPPRWHRGHYDVRPAGFR